MQDGHNPFDGRNLMLGNDGLQDASSVVGTRRVGRRGSHAGLLRFSTHVYVPQPVDVWAVIGAPWSSAHTMLG